RVRSALADEHVEEAAAADLEGDRTDLVVQVERDGAEGEVVHQVDRIEARIERGEDLRLTAEEADGRDVRPFAGVGLELAVDRDLRRGRAIHDGRARAVAGIPDPVVVEIRLVRVGDRRTVV